MWCPAHVGIEEKKEVDEVAKAATNTGSPQHLPSSLAAVKQLIDADCAASVSEPANQLILHQMRGYYNPKKTKAALSDLPRHSATAIAQLRAGHTPLAAFLHRIQAVKDPNCPECRQPETTEHYLMLCRKYTPHRIQLFEQLKADNLERNLQTLLTDP